MSQAQEVLDYQDFDYKGDIVHNNMAPSSN